MNLHRILILALVALFALPGAVAVAQTEDGYDRESGQVQDTVTESTQEEAPAVAGESATPTATPAPQAAESLPFTGGDEVIIALAGMLLVGSGVAMRRLARNN
ncbi:MAG: hypothetical protein JHC95_02955 [Solirubrobacteraceae bacterium]|nr:hypothetical protein [Solirubrobacteraceae bacterium]